MTDRISQRMKNDLDNYITGHYGEDQIRPSRKCLTVGELEDCLALLKDKTIPIRVMLNTGDEVDVVGILFQNLPEGQKPNAYYIEGDYED